MSTMPIISSEWTKEDRRLVTRAVVKRMYDVSRSTTEVPCKVVQDWAEVLDFVMNQSPFFLETNRRSILDIAGL